MTTIYTATANEQELASFWHGGMGSMLYAVASTGALSTGTIRPRWWDGEPMTDEEWGRDLLGRLRTEVGEIVPEDDSERHVKLWWTTKLDELAHEMEEV